MEFLHDGKPIHAKQKAVVYQAIAVFRSPFMPDGHQQAMLRSAVNAAPHDAATLSDLVTLLLSKGHCVS